MLSEIMDAIGNWIVATITWAGYPGVVLLMAIESACIPLPSEIIMPFAGYLVSTGRFNLFLVATAGALGCNLGSTLAYAIGRGGGRRLIMKLGFYVLLSRADLDLVEHFFERFGGITVLAARMLPVIRTFIALPAGIARMPQLRFQLYTFLGSWPWCFGLAYLGRILGEHWNNDPSLRSAFHRFDVVLAAALAILAGLYIWRRWPEGGRGGPSP